MKLKATANTILCRPLFQMETDDLTGLRKQGAILIPDSAHVNPDSEGRGRNPIVEMKVLSAGPDCKVVKPDDRILLNVNIAHRIRLPMGGEVAMILEHQIVAVVEDEVAPQASPVG